VAKTLTLASVLALAACTTTPSGSFCQIAPILIPSDAQIDVMTPDERAKHLAYLERGRRLCGWKPAS
jgi:hypothetical protein